MVKTARVIQKKIVQFSILFVCRFQISLCEMTLTVETLGIDIENKPNNG
jgi:hypothetical protein